RLGSGVVRTDDSGRPLRAVGRDAVVYELRMPTGRIVALRCHLRPDPQRDIALAERYSALGGDPHLEALRGPQGVLPRGIRWVAEGITIPGPDLRQLTLPVVAMERVPGRTLARTADRLCRERQTDPLALLADGWLATATALDTAGFSHGDFAADNIIVRPDGTMALVDLDSALWPGSPISAAHTDGTPGYAHPRGEPRDPARRDRFPALIIWASLRILARHPELRQRWGDPPDRHGAALLWSPDDLRRPGGSPLFAALAALNDPTLTPLFEVVRRAIRFSPDETPHLAEIAERLAGLGAAPAVIPPAKTSASVWAPPPTQPSPEFAPGSPGAPDGEMGTWEYRIPAPMPPARDGNYPDDSPTTTIGERDRRRAAARQVAAAVAARDTAAAVRLWEESHSLPEVATYAASVHLLVAQDASAAIDRALRRHDDDGLIAAVAQAELLGVPPSPEARIAVRAARERLGARNALHDALARGDLPSLAQLACAGRLDCLGRLEPAQARAVARARAWPALERALASDDDIAIASAADPSLWREEGSLPPAANDRLDLARRRLRWLDDVRAALRKRDDAALRGLLTTAPPGADARLTEVERRRISRISTREAAVARLDAQSSPRWPSSSRPGLPSPTCSTGPRCAAWSTASPWPRLSAPPRRPIRPTPGNWPACSPPPAPRWAIREPPANPIGPPWRGPCFAQRTSPGSAKPSRPTTMPALPPRRTPIRMTLSAYSMRTSANASTMRAAPLAIVRASRSGTYGFSGVTQSWFATLRSTASSTACTAKPSSKVGPGLTPLPIPSSRSLMAWTKVCS
ncbi:MAG: hypothetical protein K0S78_6297, partial [Thermomicrobiales bacterium]|nr:hypothetical protein [Thermomicrobiales bacterium]